MGLAPLGQMDSTGGTYFGSSLKFLWTVQLRTILELSLRTSTLKLTLLL